MLQTRVAPAAAQARARRCRSPAAIVALADARADRPSLDARASSSARCCRPPTRCCRSSVVTNPRVPRLIRHSLNLESGLNDGLALPPVLALAAALEARRQRLRVVDVRAAGRRRSGSPSASRSGSLASRAAAARRPDRGDPRAPARALRARRRVPHLRRDDAAAARQRVHRRVRLRDHARHPPARHPRATSRQRARGHRRDRQARRSSSCSARC